MTTWMNSVDGALAANARNMPSALAIDDGQVACTWAELDRDVELIGNLAEEVTSPRERVGVLMHHGREAITAIMGLIRARRTFVPLDPLWPVRRLEEVIADAEPDLILVSPTLSNRVSALAGRTLVMESKALSFTGKPRRIPKINNNICYILYTSGSTGKPKGVLQSRSNLNFHAWAFAESIPIGAGDRITQLSSCSFDAGIMDLMGAIASGATLCPFDPRGNSLKVCAEWLEQSDANLWHMTPTLMRGLLASRSRPFHAQQLRTLLFGGEALFGEDLARCRALLPPGLRIVNGFGPTECTMATQFACGNGKPASGAVPIGAPIPGIEILLQGSDGTYLPGVGEGEIVIRSPHIAIGYWRRRAETKARFTRVGGILQYATGDRGRRAPDGVLIHSGRMDKLVKVAGQGVDLVQIEAHLRTLAGVDDAAVAARLGTLNVLHAWITGPAATDLEVVRSELKSRFPSSLLPTLHRWIGSLPQTASGKLNRPELLASLDETEESGGDALLRLWRKALGTEGTFGENDNFFEAGGDSLRAIELDIMIERWTQRPSPGVFAHPSPAMMREAIHAAFPESQATVECSEMFMSAPQRRYWARKMRDPFLIAIAVPLEPSFDPAVGRRAMARILTQQPQLRTVFNQDGQPAVLQVEEEQASDRQFLTVEDALRNLRELDDPAPLRHAFAAASQRGELGAWVLLFDHTIIDGWSRRRFEIALAACYRFEARLTGFAPRFGDHAAASSRMKARSSHFIRSWIQWTSEHRSVFVAERLGRLRAGQDLIDPLAPALRLPAATTQFGTARDDASILEIELDRRVSRSLAAYCAARGVTQFSVLTACLMRAIAAWTGQGRVVLTTDRLNRSSADEDVLGLLADPVLIAENAGSDVIFETLVASVHRRVSEASSAAEPMFADLVDCVWPGGLAKYDRLFPAAVYFDTPISMPAAGFPFKGPGLEIPATHLSRDLIVNGYHKNGHLVLEISWRTQRFTHHEMTSLGNRVATELTNAVD